MVDQNLIRAKKYLPNYVSVTINKGSLNKLQKYLKPTNTFATIPIHLTTIRCFFAFGTELPENQPIRFPAWFVKLFGKPQVKFVIVH